MHISSERKPIRKGCILYDSYYMNKGKTMKTVKDSGARSEGGKEEKGMQA